MCDEGVMILNLKVQIDVTRNSQWINGLIKRLTAKQYENPKTAFSMLKLNWLEEKST